MTVAPRDRVHLVLAPLVTAVIVGLLARHGTPAGLSVGISVIYLIVGRKTLSGPRVIWISVIASSAVALASWVGFVATSR